MRIEVRRMAPAALALGGPLAWGVASGWPALGALAAIGALAVSGVSLGRVSPGPGRLAVGLCSALAQGAAVVAGTAVAGLAGAVVAGRGWITAVTVVLLAGLLAVVGGISRPMAEHSTRFIVFMVITTGVANHVEPVAAAVLFAEGAIWSLLVTALCVHAKRPRRGGRERHPESAAGA
ncbi:FUSC family membrane protein, partial [Nonomuraea sp. NPDC049784]|uniref:FUSC family membrane protein n=1 Tax=Nonomuraea sp. NPDC049784 TaxID=3154361 RepID=UPI0033E52442